MPYRWHQRGILFANNIVCKTVIGARRYSKIDISQNSIVILPSNNFIVFFKLPSYFQAKLSTREEIAKQSRIDIIYSE